MTKKRRLVPYQYDIFHVPIPGEPGGSGTEGGFSRREPPPYRVPLSPDPGSGVPVPHGRTNLPREAYHLWEYAYAALADRWDMETVIASQDGKEPPWLDDENLTGAIGHAIRHGDVERTRRLIARWEGKWEEVFGA